MRPWEHGVDRVVVWGGEKTLKALAVAGWLQKEHDRLLDGPLAQRAYWQWRILPRLARARVDILFLPGGSGVAGFRPYVAMSQNLLPFQPREMRRYGVSWMRLKLRLLRVVQGRTFRRADGVIFLNEYARDVVSGRLGYGPGRVAVIPHGCEERFRYKPRPQRSIGEYSVQSPFRILYVSTIDQYKHPWHVCRAVALLRRRGLPITLTLVGSGYGPALGRLRKTVLEADPSGEFLDYHGTVEHEEVAAVYRTADLFVFASSCENFPIILMEAMASGLPIACSATPPMPAILGDAGVYFDAESPEEIAGALETLIARPDLRVRNAQLAYDRAQNYTWERCASETLDFIVSVGRAVRGRKQEPLAVAPAENTARSTPERCEGLS
jgi:glycosyltransferase involved in cell wall biosynthesis